MVDFKIVKTIKQQISIFFQSNFFFSKLLFHHRFVIIHCSAGVGRTGVTILVETAMKQANMNMPIDFKASFIQLRAQRTLMVQMIQQYEFSIRAFLNWYGSNYED